MNIRHFTTVCLLWLSCCVAATAQTTAFTYQGKLTDGGQPTNGAFDLQFALFDVLNGGAPLGAPLSREDVVVTGGVFTVPLDFGAAAFPGAARWLEISVRPGASTGAFTLLTPRQPVTATPYAIQSLNATQLAGVAANQYVTVTSGATNFIQNQQAAPQAASNFNISGNGTAGGTLSANLVNAQTRYNLGGAHILSNVGTRNLFAGSGAGQANTLGTDNSFFGFNAGLNNIGNLTIGGRSNSFFGANAGQLLTQGRSNSFFGANAGGLSTASNNSSFFGAGAGSNSSGDDNSFFGNAAGSGNVGNENAFFGASAGAINKGTRNAVFGYRAGRQSFFGEPDPTTTGNDNAFFGHGAGAHSSTNRNSFFGSSAGAANDFGYYNSFFGSNAGMANTGGALNTFFGADAGRANTGGGQNTVIGALADVGSPNLTNATAIGANALVSNSNALVLGSIAGVNGATASTRVGIGTTTPIYSLEVRGDVSARCANVIGGPCLEVSNVNGLTFAAFADGEVAGSFNGTTFFKGDTTPLPSAYGRGIVIGYGVGASGGYISAYDYGSGTAQDLWLNLGGGRVGIGTTAPDQTLSVNGEASKPGGGSWAVFSDERLKHIKGRYTTGLKALMQLQPLRYEYKPDNALGLKSVGEHIGFGAQAVAKVIPEAVTKNEKGYLLINNDPIIWAAVNAVKEQQAQIEAQAQQINAQQTQLKRQQQQLDALRKLVCQTQPQAAACQE